MLAAIWEVSCLRNVRVQGDKALCSRGDIVLEVPGWWSGFARTHCRALSEVLGPCRLLDPVPQLPPGCSTPACFCSTVPKWRAAETLVLSPCGISVKMWNGELTSATTWLSLPLCLCLPFPALSSPSDSQCGSLSQSPPFLPKLGLRF